MSTRFWKAYDIEGYVLDPYSILLFGSERKTFCSSEGPVPVKYCLAQKTLRCDIRLILVIVWNRVVTNHTKVPSKRTYTRDSAIVCPFWKPIHTNDQHVVLVSIT